MVGATGAAGFELLVPESAFFGTDCVEVIALVASGAGVFATVDASMIVFAALGSARIFLASALPSAAALFSHLAPSAASFFIPVPF